MFKFHVTFAIEQASDFYEEKEKHASEAFASVSKAVAAVAEVIFSSPFDSFLPVHLLLSRMRRSLFQISRWTCQGSHLWIGHFAGASSKAGQMFCGKQSFKLLNSDLRRGLPNYKVPTTRDFLLF